MCFTTCLHFIVINITKLMFNHNFFFILVKNVIYIYLDVNGVICLLCNSATILCKLITSYLEL